MTDKVKTKSLREEIEELMGTPTIAVMSMEYFKFLLNLFNTSLKSLLTSLNYTIKVEVKGKAFIIPFMYDGNQSIEEYLTIINNYIMMNYVMLEKDEEKEEKEKEEPPKKKLKATPIEKDDIPQETQLEE